MSDQSDVDRRLQEADRALEECRRREIDPVKALAKACQDHDDRKSNRK